MTKELDVDIDLDRFLDLFRPEMPAPATPEEGGTEGSALEKVASTTEKPPAETRKEGTRREGAYLERFLYASRVPVCPGKAAYTRKGCHERIQRIVQVIEKNGPTLSAYVNHAPE